jgi:two-component system chemotaxis sensor kinase CheA
MDELLREFIAETNEHLATFERDLVALERVPANRPLLDDIFRNVHSIKGTCSFLELKRLESLLHATENALGRLRDEAVPATPIVVAMLLGACDRAKTIVAALARDGHEPDGGDADIVARLELAMRPAPLVPIAIPARMTAAAPRPVPSDLGQSVMKAQSEPIGQAWTKLPRLLGDLADALGKKIELKLEGGEIELDRPVLDLVKDPFMHLLRNAADHGIETPGERRRAGKAETGTVTLAARRDDSAIVITLADDGRGIDPERIRAALRRDGFATEADLQAMSEQRLLQFIFHPGLSTAPRVTTISGRGVGLDVVRSNVEKLGGVVEVASRPGHGTCFTIKLPLSLAAAPALPRDSADTGRPVLDIPPPRRAAS